ncbi:MAG: ABC transporter ATP-binding protein [Planctomycetaceae bacterium]|nr:ABC transporter ATP-binding protein [Planctomycetaceae bacterium]
MSVAIKIENISKQYRLGQVGTGTISHDLNRWWASIRGKDDPYSQVGQVNQRDQAAQSDYVWALKDIDFKVEQGEVLGIIGANGAGKSTLLKIISRITSPTTGSINIKGRIASLLEVGTGMHPEMTARENIYLNGAIMGMKRHEITRKFDDIIDFAGCKMYVDTPVKRFSSGMSVRLGFAVAAFLEPEILIVDEVLAVGDAEFQNKAIGKMKDVSSSDGRTIIFVSHNLGSVKTLCNRGIVLNEGGLAYDLPVDNAVSSYLNQLNPVNSNGEDLLLRTNRSGSGLIRLAEFWLENENGDRIDQVQSGTCTTLVFRFAATASNTKMSQINVGFSIHDKQDRSAITILYSGVQDVFFDTQGDFTVRCQIKDLPLVEGTYPISVRIMNAKEELDWIKTPIGTLDIASGDYYGTGRPIEFGKGKTLIRGNWSCRESKC